MNQMVQINQELALRLADIATSRGYNVVDMIRVHEPAIVSLQITPTRARALMDAPDATTATLAVHRAALATLEQYTPKPSVVGGIRIAAGYTEPRDPREVVTVTGQAVVPTVRAAHQAAQREKRESVTLASLLLLFWWLT